MALHINPTHTPAKAAICINRTQAVSEAPSTNLLRMHQWEPGQSQIPGPYSKATYTWRVRWWKVQLHYWWWSNPVPYIAVPHDLSLECSVGECYFNASSWNSPTHIGIRNIGNIKRHITLIMHSLKYISVSYSPPVSPQTVQTIGLNQYVFFRVNTDYKY